MKDEIKETLDILTFNKENILNRICSVEDFVSGEQIIKLLDYITNLQEENERFKEIVENLTTMTASGDRKQIKNTAQFKLDICKQRIDKAIKYIEFEQKYSIPYKEELIELSNILQGSDE